MDLAAVRMQDIDFGEMANALSKIARFNGRYRDLAYSVAQHGVMGADALYNETGDAQLAGCFLLHDGHEYLIGDTPMPAVNFFCVFLDEIEAEKLRLAIHQAKRELDTAIYLAAGLGDYPDRFPAYAREVKRMDERMLRAEAIALFGHRAGAHAPAARLPAPKLTGAIRPWGAMKAEEAFLDRLARYVGIEVRSAF